MKEHLFRKKRLLHILEHFALLGAACAFTYQFGTIWLFGSYGREPNPAILAFELVVLGGGLGALAINRIIHDWRKH